MTARVASNYTKSRIKSVFQSEQSAAADRIEVNRQSGELIAQTLGELKGAVMKVGQMASIAKDVLPRELADALQSLQRDAPPMDYEVIAEQIEKEFGCLPETLFSEFSREPFASASIGQVHRAKTDDGREVVVKVQYPGVDGAVDSDLTQLKWALRASGLARMNRRALDALFAEMRRSLVEELDYCNEADNARLFHEHYADDDRVVVPQVVGERSSQRVLTLTYEPGDQLSETTEYPQEVRDKLGETLFSLLADQIFDWRVLHADPNPANFAFRPDGTMVLYDFGCVKQLNNDIIDAYRDTINACLVEDYSAVEDGMLRLGARDPDGPAVPLEYYKQWRDLLAKPILGKDFDYGTSEIHREVLKLVPGFLAKHLRSFQPPTELVFVDRVVVGHYGTLRHLQTHGNFRAILQPYL